MTTTTISEREIVVNGQSIATAADTLAALVEAQGFAGVKVATAVNGDFVPERLRAETTLDAGDRIEILTVRQGG